MPLLCRQTDQSCSTLWMLQEILRPLDEDIESSLTANLWEVRINGRLSLVHPAGIELKNPFTLAVSQIYFSMFKSITNWITPSLPFGNSRVWTRLNTELRTSISWSSDSSRSLYTKIYLGKSFLFSCPAIQTENTTINFISKERDGLTK